MKQSVLMLASFEMTTDHLYNSAIQCKKDNIQGVTECIVMGTQVPIGTGMFKVCFDDTVKPDSSVPVARTPGKKQAKRTTTKSKEVLKRTDDLIFDAIH